MKRFFPLAVFILLAATLALNLNNPPSKTVRSAPALLGKQLPAFELPMLEASGSFSNALWQGKAAVIHVFASWCSVCSAEHEAVRSLTQHGIPIYGIAWRDNAQNASTWLAKHDAGKPSAYTHVGLDSKGAVTALLGLTGTPETIVVSAQGVILFRHPSVLTKDIIESQVLPFFKGTAP